MEFTPNKSGKNLFSSLRHNPYASGGQKYVKKYQQSFPKSKILHGTPGRRTYGLQKYKPKCLLTNSRTSKILENSHSINSERDNGKENVPLNIAKKNLGCSKSGDNNKPNDLFFDLFKSSDSEDEINLSNDKVTFSVRKRNKNSPHKVYSNNRKSKSLKLNSTNDSDSDNEIFIQDKQNVSKKENWRSSITNYFKKSDDSLPSKSLLCDIDPTTVSNAYGSSTKSSHLTNGTSTYKFKSFKGKENLSLESSTETQNETPEYPYLIGFPNHGNTCYLNAVTQSLVGLSCFTGDLLRTMSKIFAAPSTISHSLWNIIVNRQKCDLNETRKSLRMLKENLERLDPSFSGFKMQDANEFLTRVLDAVNDEIEESNSDQSFIENKNISHSPMKQSQSRSNLQFKSSIFDTPSPDSDVSLDTKMEETLNNSNGDSKYTYGDSCFENKFNSPLKNLSIDGGTLNMSPVTPKKSLKKCINNPVKDNFLFELLESYTCLGCNNLVDRKQNHFALYVNLPKEGEESIRKAVEIYMSEHHRDLNCEKCDHKQVSVSTSFASLPRILIVQVKRYEYKAEQLASLKVSSKIDVNKWLHLQSHTSKNVTLPNTWMPEKSLSLVSKTSPRVPTLSVRNLSSELNICSSDEPVLTESEKEIIEINDKTPTKEERDLQEAMELSIKDQGGQKTDEANIQKEEEEFQKAIKLSLQDIGMEYSFNNELEVSHTNENDCEDEKPSNTSYRLLSVISHFGVTTCTGHYVADVYNANESNWFHYDDEFVSKIKENIVFADGRKKNAYICFYVQRDIFKNFKFAD